MGLPHRYILAHGRLFDMASRPEARAMLLHLDLDRPGLAALVSTAAARLSFQQGVATSAEQVASVIAVIRTAQPIAAPRLIANIVYRGRVAEGLLDLRERGAAGMYAGRGATGELVAAIVDAAKAIPGAVLLTPDFGPFRITEIAGIATAAAVISGADPLHAARVISAHQRQHPGAWHTWCPATHVNYIAHMLRRSAAVGESDPGRIAAFFG